jgi:hypothetical protein
VAHTIRLGTVLWARFGPRGGWVHRPAVALGPPNSEGKVPVAVASTSPPDDPGRAVVLPWRREGHPLTRLRRETFLDAGWIRTIDAADADVKGSVTAACRLEILTKVRKFMEEPGNSE